MPEIKAYLSEVDSKPLFKLAMRATHEPTGEEAFQLLRKEAQAVWQQMLDSQSK